MSNFLRQSTASQSRSLGPFVDDTDFKTAETALTIANTDIKLIVNGGASANKNSGGGTHRANGHYGVTFDATDTATVGEIEVSVVVSGALPVFKTFFVVEEAVYDMLFAASALGYVANAPVSVAQIAGVAVSTSTAQLGVNVVSTAAGAITATSIATNAIDADALATDAVTEIQAGLATATEVAKIPKSDGTATWNATALASLQAEATDALNAYDPPTQAEMNAAIAAGDDATLAAIAAQATEVAKIPKSDGSSTWNATALAALQQEATDALNAYDPPTHAELITALAAADDAVLAAIAALNNLSSAQVNAEVVDALNVDTYAEPTGVPAATASIVAKLGRLHQVLRNRIHVTASAKTFYDDAASPLWIKDLSDDGTTYVETEGHG